MSLKSHTFCVSKRLAVVAVIVTVLSLYFFLSYLLAQKKVTLQNRASEIHSNDALIGGVDVVAGEFPAVTLLGNSCTGTLIHPRFVLTAAHCADGLRTVKIGTVSRRNLFNDTVEVERSIIYPDYQVDNRGYNDIALVQLKEAVTSVPLPLLPYPQTDEYMYDKDNLVTLVGWGCTAILPTPGTTAMPVYYEDGNYQIQHTNRLQKMILPIYSSSLTSEGRPNEFDYGYVDERALTQTTCFGDSGAPVFYKKNNNLYLIGVHKKGFSVIIGTDEGTKTIGFTEWIHDMIGALTESEYPHQTLQSCRRLWPVCPAGFSCNLKDDGTGTCFPDEYLYMFLSSHSFSGNLGGVEGADVVCQNMAREAGLEGVFRAFISTESNNIKDRIETKNLPYVTVNGYRIADSFDNFTTNRTLYPIVYDEYGALVLGNNTIDNRARILTGMDNYTNSVSDTCSNWTNYEGSFTPGMAQFTTHLEQSWLRSDTLASCRYTNPGLFRLYCIEDR